MVTVPSAKKTMPITHIEAVQRDSPARSAHQIGDDRAHAENAVPEREEEQQEVERAPERVRPAVRHEVEHRFGRDIEKVRNDEVTAGENNQRQTGNSEEIPGEPVETRNARAQF